MTPDPVVLRHDDPIAIAIHKMAVGGFRHIPILDGGRPTGVVTARDVFHHLAETPRLTARVAVLADDLIWATRLADLVRGAGAEARPVRIARRARGGPARCRSGRRRPDRARLRRSRGDRRAPMPPGVRSSPSASTTTSTLRKAALAAGADRVHPYRRLFEDGPRQIAAWLATAPAVETPA